MTAEHNQNNPTPAHKKHMRFHKAAIVCPSCFVMGITTSSLNFALVFYSHDKFGANAFQASLLCSLYSLAYLISCMVVGKFFQNLPPYKSLLIGISGLLIGMILLLMAPTLKFAYVTHLLNGCSMAFYWPMLMGWLSIGMEGKQLSRNSSIFNFSWSTGTIIAPFLAGLLSDINAAYPIYACIAFCTVNLIYVAIAGAHADEAPPKPKTSNSTTVAATAPASRSPLIRFPSWIGVLCAWLPVGFLLYAYPLVAEKTLGFSRHHVGNLLLVRALLTTLAMSAMGFFQFWQFKYWQLVAGHAILALTTLLFGFAKGTAAILVLMAVTGIFNAHAYTNSMFHGISGSTNRTSRMAAHETLLSVGTVLGGALSGHIFVKTDSLRSCAMVIAILTSTAIIVDIAFWIVAKRTNQV
jgi:MFS family permease